MSTTPKCEACEGQGWTVVARMRMRVAHGWNGEPEPRFEPEPEQEQCACCQGTGFAQPHIDESAADAMRG